MQEIYGIEAHAIKEHQQNERMLSHLLPYLNNPKALLEVNLTPHASDRKLSTPQLQDKLSSALIQYLVTTASDATYNGMTRHFRMHTMQLTRLFAKAYPRDLSPDYGGKRINELRKDAGADYSYLEEVMKKYDIDIGLQDITKDIRIPNVIDENVSRAAGWLSTAAYIASYENYRGRQVLWNERFGLTFRSHDLAFIDYELVPFFEGYHNHAPTVSKYNTRFRDEVLHGYGVNLGTRAILNFYKKIGLKTVMKDRTILFEQNQMRNSFVSGLIDIWGSIHNNRGYPALSITINSKYSTLLRQLQEIFSKGNGYFGGKVFRIHLATGEPAIHILKNYPISNPRLVYPIEYYKHYGKYPDK